MRVAQIENGVVVNVVEVDPDNRPDFMTGWPDADGSGPGWIYDGEAFFPPPVPQIVIGPDAVNAERDRRLNGTLSFQGKEYDCGGESLSRITGAATLAGFAIGAGAIPGDLRWHGGASDFVWIANDNSLTPMDAQTCFAFGQAAANNQSAHVFAARALKDMSPIPTDYTNDGYWP